MQRVTLSSMVVVSSTLPTRGVVTTTVLHDTSMSRCPLRTVVGAGGGGGGRGGGDGGGVGRGGAP